jgi:hypothetical protein
MGYEIKRGIASREEMEKVDRMTTVTAIKAVPTEKETLLKSVSAACKLLDESGDEPKWTFTRLKEYVKTEMGAART